MKIGRRKHLRQLGLGAAGILGAGLFKNDLSLVHRLTPGLMPKLKAREWPWTTTKPQDNNPGIRIIFAGMMGFTYKGKQGRVVFHTGDSDHKLEILVFERDPCNEIKRIEQPLIPAKIDLLSLSGHPDDVQFFQSGDPDDFNRKGWQDQDFRWLLDLEGPETYSNRDLKRIQNKGFNKKLHITSGCFYTYERTKSTFTTDVGSLMCPEFSVAKIMACDIPLRDTETFSLMVGSQTVEMKNPSKYEIYFLNICATCEHSDFPMIFDAVENGETYKFGLTLNSNKDPRVRVPPENLCYPLKTRVTDEAPCMGAGFGAGRGFPGS